MAEERAQRRLAAILAADVVGYSRLMEQDEAGTLAVLKSRRRDVLDPIVAKHRGRIFKVAGDGALVEFSSAVDAVQCAVDLQRGMAAANGAQSKDRPFVLRIGVNLGDVMVEGDDLYGDGINIAARLEANADPGGILISATVYEHIKYKVSAEFEDLGVKALKNITEPIRAYRIAGTPRAPLAAVDPVSDKPSVAVLPFTNMSSDREQEFFADGLSEDLITELSKVPGVFVIARHSTFAYKGKPIDIRQTASELGVNHVIEGSVRRAANRLRITVQLIDARTGNHLWADRFDREMKDVFEVQDEIVKRIVESLPGRLKNLQLGERYRPANLEAYNLCLLGRAQWQHSVEAASEARSLFERAIELDPQYSEAHRWLALCLSAAWQLMYEPMDLLRARSLALARRAVALDPLDSGARWVLGRVLAYEELWESANAEFEAALRLNPNDADAWSNFADLKVSEGDGAGAIECVERALRLNPHPPAYYYWDLGLAQYAAGRYEDAVVTLRREQTYHTGSRRLLAAALAQLGRLDEARGEARLFLAANPDFRISRWFDTNPFRDAETGERLAEGFRRAGLPE